MRALPFCLSLIAAGLVGFVFPNLVDTFESLLPNVQARPVMNIPAEPTETKQSAKADRIWPIYPLLLAGSVTPQAISETEVLATRTGRPTANDKVADRLKQRGESAKLQTNAGGLARKPTQMASMPRRPPLQADRVAEGPLPTISQLLSESAHRQLERVANNVRTR
jgi:hypothetical protein